MSAPPTARLRRLVLAALGAALLAAPGCGGSERPLSAVLVTLDTTRADVLARPEITPSLQALAAEGVSYVEARTVAPLTQPAHASMFTGLVPPRHGVRVNQIHPLPAAAETVAERARAAGYRTAAFVASLAVDRAVGLGQGFEVYDQPRRPVAGAADTHVERRADEVVARATRWLAEREPDEPFFLWVHLFDPHAPYEPPDGFLAQAGGDAYHGEVAAMDAAVGELVAALKEHGAWDDTYLVVIGDHGEALGENGEDTHGVYAYPPTIRVPFLVRDPRAPRAGERSREIVSVVDVHPTLLGALGLGAPGDVDGVSLFRRRVPEDRGVYFEAYNAYVAYGMAPIAGWADRAGAYVHDRDPIFVPGDDDDGRLDAAEAERYRAAIAEIASRPALPREPAAALDPGLDASLRALGYAAVAGAPGELPHPLADTGRPSPHERKDEYRALVRARALAEAGHTAEAVDAYREITRAHPGNTWANERLASLLLREGRHAEALPHLERLVAEGARWPSTVYNLALCLLRSGRREEAEARLRETLALDPDHVPALMSLVALLERRGDLVGARRFRDEFERVTGRVLAATADAPPEAPERP